MFRRCHSLVVSTRASVLALLFLQGLCVWGEEATISAFVGGTVELTSGYQEENADVEWNFKDKIIAEVIDNKAIVNLIPQFEGRLQINTKNFSLKVTKLTKEDSGEFTFVVTTKAFRKKIKLQVYDDTLTVQVSQNVTVHQQNNTCSVSLLCIASGPPDAKFSWSGDQTGNGSILRFPLSPADGSVKLTCTAVRGKNQKSYTVTVKCSNETQTNSSKPDDDNYSKEWYLYFVAIPAACGSLVLTVIIAAVVHCHWRHKAKSREQNTVYADITPDPNQKQISPSVTAVISIYETVNERESLPQTLYDEVNFSRGAKESIGPTQRVVAQETAYM